MAFSSFSALQRDLWDTLVEETFVNMISFPGPPVGVVDGHPKRPRRGYEWTFEETKNMTLQVLRTSFDSIRSCKTQYSVRSRTRMNLALWTGSLRYLELPPSGTEEKRRPMLGGLSLSSWRPSGSLSGSGLRGMAWWHGLELFACCGLRGPTNKSNQKRSSSKIHGFSY